MTRRTRERQFAATTVIVLLTTPVVAGQFAAENAAMRVLDTYMTALNDGDPKSVCRSFHYPYVQFAAGMVRTYETLASCQTARETARDGRSDPHRSGWDRRTVVQAYPETVHVTVISSRFNEADQRVAQLDALFIITRVNGRWGIRGYSQLDH
ncbi:MAG: hypothetical protein VYE68_10480 [Acidobacteriota bacterium]|nr:hypothetical protein [Acidobacteriota bacterium]